MLLAFLTFVSSLPAPRDELIYLTADFQPAAVANMTLFSLDTYPVTSVHHTGGMLYSCSGDNCSELFPS